MPPRRARGEGSISQREDGLWVGRLDVTQAGGPRKRKAVYGHTRKEVQRKLGIVRREYEAHGSLPTADLTVEAWMNLWLTEIAPARVQATTLPGYRSKVQNYIIPAIGKHRLDKLRPDHLRAMYRGMERRDPPLSQNTRQQTHAILSRALKVAVREGKATRNVAELIDPPGAEVKDMTVLSAEEITTLLLHIRGMAMESRWLAAVAIGLRQGECLGLEWRYVDLEAGTLKVEQSLARLDGEPILKGPKSKRSRRTIPLPTDVLDSLKARRAAYLEEREAPGYDDRGLVWGQPSGKPRAQRRDYQDWVDLLYAAGVSRVRLHDARHSAATTLVLLGVPLPIIAAILGHADISTTMRYVSTDLTAMQAAMDLLNASRRRALEG